MRPRGPAEYDGVPALPSRTLRGEQDQDRARTAWIRAASAAALATLTWGAAPVAAQEPGSDTLRADEGRAQTTLVLPGEPSEDRLRTAELLRPSGTPGWTIRSASSLAAPLAGSAERPRAALVLPRTAAAWNSALPFSLGDGSLWAGRGWSLQAEAGLRAEYGPVRLFLVPELVYAENAEFQVIGGPPERSAFLPPWRRGDQSADLPHRFGDAAILVLHPGQSSISVGAGPAQAGVATENQWWGPGIRNAIILSDNAPGFPHAFLRTRGPVETRLGAIEARWIVGALGESLHYDTVANNDTRSLSGLVVALTPPRERGLTLGAARVVYAPVSGASAVLGRALDAVSRWDQENARTESPSEQIFALFGRWIFPADGLEVYAEWARTELPDSLRDLAFAPIRSQGYTLGLQWARPFTSGDLLRLQTELTYLEKADPPTRSFYTSARVPQGYTHRGQVLGAAIGPGASSQWLALDYSAPAWQAGAFLGRIRWDNDAYYTTDNPTLLGHDVSVYGGVRGTSTVPGAVISAELAYGVRYNYLFQNEGIGFDQGESEDVGNTTLKISVIPGLRLPRITPLPAPPPPPPPRLEPSPAPEPPAEDPARSVPAAREHGSN